MWIFFWVISIRIVFRMISQVIALRMEIEWGNVWMIAVHVQLAMVSKRTELRVVTEEAF
jgi:hypothetical protein